MKVGTEVQGMQLQAQERPRKPTATRSWRDKEQILPLVLQREHGPTDTLILDFGTPELQENTFLWF